MASIDAADLPSAAAPLPLSRESFERTFGEFCHRRGMPFQLTVDCQGMPLDLYHALATILRAGGGGAVTEARAWSAASEAILQGREFKSGLSLHVRHLYETYLQPFENMHRGTLLASSFGDMNFPSRQSSVSGDSGGTPCGRGRKRRSSDSPGPSEREDSPATSGGGARSRGGKKPRSGGPGDAGATAKPTLAPNHQLSNRAILPPHGRGRTPKVLPPTLLRRATPPVGSSAPGAATATATPRSSADPRAAYAAAVAAKPAAPKGRSRRSLTAARELADSGVDSIGASESEAVSAAVPPLDPRRPEPRRKGKAPPVETVAGVKLVAPPAGDGGRTPLGPAVSRASHARWQMQGFASTEQHYGTEPLAAMLGWLRDAARELGHCSPWEPPLLPTMETQTYEEGLGRWRAAEYEGLEAPPPPPLDPGKRRSARNRGSSQVFSPLGSGKVSRDYLDGDASDDEKETREGPGFQAELPPLRPRPAGATGPPPEEAKWLTGRILAPNQLSARPVPEVDLASMPIEERMKLEQKAVVALRSAVGPYAGVLGLNLMGPIAGRDWSDQEAALLEEGMRLVGRDFRRIAVSLLPGRREADLVLYYYNVWKTRSTPRARAWFAALEAARKAEEAEAAAAAAEIAEAEAQRITTQTTIVQTRQLRDALNWQRASARWPKDSLPRQKQRERILRIKALMASQNVGRIAGETALMPSSPYND